MASHWRDKSRHLEVQMHAGNGRYEQHQHAPASTVLYGNLRAEILRCLRIRQDDAAADHRGLAPSCIYLRAHGDRVGDLLQDLVERLYICDQPVKPTPPECARLLGQISGVVAIDDLDASPDRVGYLLEVLSGCSLVIGSARPVLGRHGSSHKLDGLPEQTALALIADGLGRELTAEERAAAGRLATAVDGQPLHLRQCAALAREGRHTLRSLAQQAAHDPQILDRLAINALAQHERRAPGRAGAGCGHVAASCRRRRHRPSRLPGPVARVAAPARPGRAGPGPVRPAGVQGGKLPSDTAQRSGPGRRGPRAQQLAGRGGPHRCAVPVSSRDGPFHDGVRRRAR